jgi:hypothetical protein
MRSLSRRGEREMSKEQIEEIWDILTTDCDRECVGCEFENDEWCFTHFVANKLYNAGYRKQSEVIDSFVARLKEAPIKCGIPLLGLSTKEEIEEYFNGIMLQVRDVIDSIAKKMKGGE